MDFHLALAGSLYGILASRDNGDIRHIFLIGARNIDFYDNGPFFRGPRSGIEAGSEKYPLYSLFIVVSETGPVP